MVVVRAQPNSGCSAIEGFALAHESSIARGFWSMGDKNFNPMGAPLSGFPEAGAEIGAPSNAVKDGSLDHVLLLVERKEILDALHRAAGRRTIAARLLGISRSRLYRRMAALNIAFDETPSNDG